MIYLDNAATTMCKPECVARAVAEAMCGAGNAGRGGHGAALDASRIVFGARRKLSELFHADSPMQIAFTANSTMALNTALKGVLQPGDHVITTAMEHNSVLRPLFEMEEKGVEVSILAADGLGRINYDDFERHLRANTRAVVCTHGSNLTGNVVDIGRIGAFCRKSGLLFIVDASQTAGVFPIDMQKMHIDILCFTGHKALMGPQGTGGMAVREGIEVRPLVSGGSGIQTFSRRHPVQMPAALEAGTLNVHGIAGLSAALDYICETGMESIRLKEQALAEAFYLRVKELPNVRLYGDFSSRNRCPIVTLNVGGYDSAQVSDALFEEYGISVRSGGHCAPLMHRALGTEEQGAVRFSFSHLNTMEEVEIAVHALRQIAEEDI